MTASKSKTTYSTVWLLPVNNGDGSVSVRFFSSREKAERYESFEHERFSEGPCQHTFTIIDGHIVLKDEKHYNDTEE